MSDIGGILGLYIGFSILTIVEFVELFIDITRLFAMKAFCSKKSDKQPTTAKSSEKLSRDDNNQPQTPENALFSNANSKIHPAIPISDSGSVSAEEDP